MSRLDIFGLPLDPLTIEEAVGVILGSVRARKKIKIFTPNTQHIAIAQFDREFKKMYSRIDLSLADGMPLVWLARASYKNSAQRITGVDLMLRLCEAASKNDISIFLLGAEEDILRLAYQKLKNRYPGLKISGWHRLAFEKMFAADEVGQAVKNINSSNAGMLFVALGSPEQEKWINEFSDRINASVFLGVGQAFKVISGQVRRAPVWMQLSGLEWLFRVQQEPARLWKRYLFCNTVFLWLVFIQIIKIHRFKRAKSIFAKLLYKITYLRGGSVKSIFNFLSGYPSTLSVDISAVCNINCVMCSLADYPGAKVMDMRIFQKLGKAFQKIFYLHLGCSGEPLMNQQLMEMIDFVNEASQKRCRIGLSTNATLLNEEVSHQLLERQVGRVVFSLDAADQKRFEEIRKGASFDGVLNNIRSFLGQQAVLKNNTTIVEAWIVASQKNIHQLVDILMLLNRLGIKRAGINSLEPYTKEMSDLVPYDNALEYGQALKNCLNYARKTKMELLAPSIVPLRPFCGAKINCLVTTEGDVVPCSGLAYPRVLYKKIANGLIRDAQNQRQKLSFGNIQKEEFLDIWKSREYSNWRKTINRSFPGQCQDCLMKNGIICP